MELIFDSRNQQDDFVVKSLEKLGHTCHRDFKLAFGDVALSSNVLNCIDLKSSGGGLIELMRNICSKDHIRLKAEINKVVAKGGKLTFLCFEPGITCIDDITKWKMPHFKSTTYKTVWYEKDTNKQVTVTKMKQAFTKAWKDGLINAYGNYNESVRAFGRNFYYGKKELAHTAGERYSHTKPETLMKALKTMSEPNHYGNGVTIGFEFTTKENCGEKIIEILTRGNDEKTTNKPNT